LGELLETRPLAQGLGELVAYLQLASEAPNSVVDEDHIEAIDWLAQDASQQSVTRRARLPRVIFVRN
jgi:hypothetical protein